MAKGTQIITGYGTMWARNDDNITEVPPRAQGVYFLFDGSMPVYVGKGHIQSRLRAAKRSKRRRDFWDRFSWYQVGDHALMHDIEVLALRLLPPYLRALTRQEGHFVRARRAESVDDKADTINRKVRRRAK